MRPAALVLSLVTAACVAPPDDASTLESGIRKGTADTTHPAVVALLGSHGCTGTLVAPSKVLTAAHCVTDPASPFFLAGTGARFDLGDRSFTVPYRQAVVAPGFPAQEWSELAVITLDAAVTAVAPVPVHLAPLDASIAGTKGTIVGYGAREATDPKGRLSAEVTISRLTDHQLALDVAQNGGITVDHGDSGGPLLKDGEIVGVAYGISAPDPARIDYGIFARLDLAAEWLQAQGIVASTCASTCTGGARCSAGTCLESEVAACAPQSCAAGEGCDVAADACVVGGADLPSCTADRSCSPGLACSPRGACVSPNQCATNGDCAPGRLCGANATCVVCRVDADCRLPGLACVEGYCVAAGACDPMHRTGCAANETCALLRTGPTCQSAGDVDEGELCSATNRCRAGLACDGVCRALCDVRSPRCPTDRTCVLRSPAAGPFGTCVGCSADAACAATPSTPRCEPLTQTCVQCRATLDCGSGAICRENRCVSKTADPGSGGDTGGCTQVATGWIALAAMIAARRRR